MKVNERFEDAIVEEKKAMAEAAWMKDSDMDCGQLTVARIDAWSKKDLGLPALQKL